MAKGKVEVNKPSKAESESKAKASAAKEETQEASDEEEEDEEEANWWEQEQIDFAGRGEKQWDTLEHNGVLFPPEYVPHNIPILYDGVEFRMTKEEEEVATMFAVMKESDYYRNEIFRRNFFADWRNILDKRGSHPIRILELCDFEAIWNWHVTEKAKKLARSKEEKKIAKQELDKEMEPFKFCYWNGKKEQVANFRVEPPGLFRGRGKHPLAGKLKTRVRPEDVTINIGPNAKVPAPPAGHQWKEVRHDNTVTWLAMWCDNIAGNFKYVMLHASSAVKGKSDMMKFEKARRLKDCVQSIRESYRKSFNSSSRMERQRAVCIYFIDKLALRVGNEKGEDEAETVGCCSLQVAHVTPKENNNLYFNFLGKDSIQFENTVEVDPRVHQLICEFRKGKSPVCDIFDEVTTSALNDHLKNFMPGLTAKVFRTYNASICLQEYFKKHPMKPNLSEAEKLLYFNAANTEVALLCNHQRTVSKGHAAAMAVVDAKLQHLHNLVARLEAIKPLAAKDFEKAAKKFFEEEDKIQNEWLEKYGNDDQKAEYAAIIANRGVPKARTAKEEAESDDEKSPVKGKKPQPKKVEPKKRERAKKEESDSEDETIAAVLAKGKGAAKTPASAAPAPKKAAKVEPKKAAPKKSSAKKGAKDEDSDDDVRISDL